MKKLGSLMTLLFLLSTVIFLSVLVKAEPIYSLNSTNSTVAGTPVSHNLYWEDDSLSGFIFSFCNGTYSSGSLDVYNITSLDQEPSTQRFNTTVISGVDIEPISPTDFTDVNTRWDNEGNAYDNNNATYASETQTRVENHIYWITWNTSTGTINRVDLHIRFDLTGLTSGAGGDTMQIQWWVGATQGSGTCDYDYTNEGIDLVCSFTDVTEPNDGDWSWTDISNIQIRQIGTQNRGPDVVTYAVDEVWGRVTVSSVIPNMEKNTTNVTYYNIGGDPYQNVDKVEAIIKINTYNPSASNATYNNNQKPDLEVGLYNGSAYVNSTCQINKTMGDGYLNTTAWNCTINSTATDVRNAWKYPNNRSIQLKGFWLDSYDSTIIDEINVTDVFAYMDAWNDSRVTGLCSDAEAILTNSSWVEMTGTGNWSNITKIINETEGTTIKWCVYANDTSDNWNSTSCQNPFTYITQGWGYLEVILTEPDTIEPSSITQNFTFVMNASVYCRNGYCGYVNGTSMYNLTSPYPDTPINITQGDVPFFVNETPSYAMKTCSNNPLSNGDFCNLTWIINATGPLNTDWKVGVLFNSSDPEVEPNNTLNATVSIISCTVDFSVAWSSINFGQLNPDTYNNSAPGNGNKEYNVTVNPGSCNVDLYMRGTDLVNTTYNYTIEVGNISWSNISSDIEDGFFPLTYTDFPIKMGADQNTNVTTWYWLNVPSIYSAHYNSTIYIGGVKSE